MLLALCYYVAWSDWGCCCDCCLGGCCWCSDATVILCPLLHCCRTSTLMMCNEPDRIKIFLTSVSSHRSITTNHLKDGMNSITVLSLCLLIIHLTISCDKSVQEKWTSNALLFPTNCLQDNLEQISWTPSCSRRANQWEAVLGGPLGSMFKMSFPQKSKYKNGPVYALFSNALKEVRVQSACLDPKLFSFYLFSFYFPLLSKRPPSSI